MACRDQMITPNYAIYNGDCISVMQSLPDASIGLSVYSPPFMGLYQYSSDPADISNTKNMDEFFDHYGFVVKELSRITMPGRMTAVHCQEVFQSGDPSDIIDFPGDIIRLHTHCRKANCNASERDRSHGFCGHGLFKLVARYQVWKEPLLVRNRTMLKSLHHKTFCLDSTKCSMANADVLLIFRNAGKNEVPVDHPVGLTSYAGSRPVPDEVMKWKGHKGNQINNGYSQWCWRQYASAFWDDVRLDRTLGTGASLYSNNRADKDEPDEKHMHPLQLDVIERAIVMWSNPGETVLTPFMGVGSEVCGAIINGRRGVGIELKPTYYRQAVENMKLALLPREEVEGILFKHEELGELSTLEAE